MTDAGHKSAQPHTREGATGRPHRHGRCRAIVALLGLLLGVGAALCLVRSEQRAGRLQDDLLRGRRHVRVGLKRLSKRLQQLELKQARHERRLALLRRALDREIARNQALGDAPTIGLCRPGAPIRSVARFELGEAEFRREERALLEEVRTGSVRIVPSPLGGFKLYFPRGSPRLARYGLRAADLMRRVNGIELNQPDDDLAFQRFRAAEMIVVDLCRGRDHYRVIVRRSDS